VSTTINHAALAVARIASQHRTPKFLAWVAAVTEAFDDLEAAANQVAQLDDIDAMNRGGGYVVNGVNLDIVGKRIGQPRRIPGGNPRILFGFDDDALADTFGEEDNPLLGGIWWDVGDPLTGDAVLDDETYRLALRARRYLNQTTVANADDVYAFLRFVMPDYADGPMGPIPFMVMDMGGMAFEVQLTRQPTLAETVILTQAGVMPKPVGVGKPIVSWWTYGAPTFGFDDDATAETFGEDDDPTAGGVFAEETLL
jgi:hypothetical protein